MPDTQLYTNEAASRKAIVVQTSLASSKLRLFKSTLVITRFTTRAQLIAAECDFSGYTAGGYALAAWTGPTMPAGGGALLTSPIVNPAYVPPEDEDPSVSNSVGGWWVDDATSKVRVSGTYDPPRTIGGAGDGFAVVIQILEALNPVAPPSE